MTSTTVIIVTHNSAEVVDECLRSCGGLDVLVVDNASEDDTVQRVKRHTGVRLVANSNNRGFAGGVNQGVQATASDHLLLLNPDARLEGSPMALSQLLDRDSACGIAAGLLTSEDGGPQRGFSVRRFPRPVTLAFEAMGINALAPWNPVNRNYRYLDRNFTAISEVDQPAAAFLMFRREVWAALGGFDERYHPVWFEDVDFCKRAKDRGYRIMLVPFVRALHSGGHSVKRLAPGCREAYWYGSLLKYAAKHYPAGKTRFVGAAVVLGSALRAIAGAITTRNLKPFAAYSKAIRLAAACTRSGHFPDCAC